MPFPGFDEDIFPLVLIKEWKFVVIFNIELKEYIKVTDIITEKEADMAYN